MQCRTCTRELDDMNDPTSADRGGECLLCQAAAHDKAALKELQRILNELNGKILGETLRSLALPDTQANRIKAAAHIEKFN